MHAIKTLAAIAALAITCPAWAINKCTGPDGKTSYQDTPCQGNGSTIKPVIPRTTSQLRDPNPALQGPPDAAPLLAVYRRWIDAEKLASSTGRIAMSQPVSAMQTLAREAESMQVKPCLRDAHTALVGLAKGSTDAMLKFMRDEGLSAMVYSYVDRKRLVARFEDAVVGAKCDS